MSEIIKIKKLLETCYKNSIDVVFSHVSTHEFEGSACLFVEDARAADMHKSMSLKQMEVELKRAIKACEGIVGHQAFSDLEDFYKGLDYEVGK